MLKEINAKRKKMVERKSRNLILKQYQSVNLNKKHSSEMDF